jgi:hypothetical protein
MLVPLDCDLPQLGRYAYMNKKLLQQVAEVFGTEPVGGKDLCPPVQSY